MIIAKTTVLIEVNLNLNKRKSKQILYSSQQSLKEKKNRIKNLVSTDKKLPKQN